MVILVIMKCGNDGVCSDDSHRTDLSLEFCNTLTSPPSPVTAAAAAAAGVVGVEFVDGSVTRHETCSSTDRLTAMKLRHQTHNIVSYFASFY